MSVGKSQLPVPPRRHWTHLRFTFQKIYICTTWKIGGQRKQQLKLAACVAVQCTARLSPRCVIICRWRASDERLLLMATAGAAAAAAAERQGVACMNVASYTPRVDDRTPRAPLYQALADWLSTIGDHRTQYHCIASANSLRLHGRARSILFHSTTGSSADPQLSVPVPVRRPRWYHNDVIV